MDRVLVFILGLPLGILIMVYRAQIKGLFGEIQWAEKNLGTGGTYTLILGMGLIVSILSVMYAFGSLQSFVSGSFGAFF